MANITQNQTAEQNRRLLNILKKKVNFLRSMVYVSVAGLVIVTITIVYLLLFNPEVENFYGKVKTSIRGGEATLFLSPNIEKLQTGEEFKIDVLVDTKGRDVNAVAAYLSYNKDCMEALNIDLADSIFPIIAEKDINLKDGKIKITVGKPTPGININNGKVATISFKAIKQSRPYTSNIYFDFTEGSSLFSAVFLDDKKGTNILNETRGALISID